MYRHVPTWQCESHTPRNTRKGWRDAKLPVYFAGFLQDATNKEEHFDILTEDDCSQNWLSTK